MIRAPRRTVVVSTAALLVTAGAGAALAAPHHRPDRGYGSSGIASTTATAVFYRGLLGTSRFTQQSGAIEVHGAYGNLLPGQSYFTVIYANNNCDPAQAFPVGPFTADARGVARLDMTVPTSVPVAGTMSMSVRRADSSIDEDRDGKVGITDVIAVPGQPAIGLVECNSRPVVIVAPTSPASPSPSGSASVSASVSVSAAASSDASASPVPTVTASPTANPTMP